VKRKSFFINSYQQKIVVRLSNNNKKNVPLIGRNCELTNYINVIPVCHCKTFKDHSTSTAGAPIPPETPGVVLFAQAGKDLARPAVLYIIFRVQMGQ